MKMAEMGIREQEYSIIKRDSIKKVLGDLWQMSGNYWELVPANKISALKQEVDKFIAAELKKNVRVSFEDKKSYKFVHGSLPYLPVYFVILVIFAFSLFNSSNVLI